MILGKTKLAFFQCENLSISFNEKDLCSPDNLLIALRGNVRSLKIYENAFKFKIDKYGLIQCFGKCPDWLSNGVLIQIVFANNIITKLC